MEMEWKSDSKRGEIICWQFWAVSWCVCDVILLLSADIISVVFTALRVHENSQKSKLVVPGRKTVDLHSRGDEIF